MSRRRRAAAQPLLHVLRWGNLGWPRVGEFGWPPGPENVGSDRRWQAQLTAYSNVFVERLWRSVKYERVYLKAYDSVSAAKADIAEYMDWYNTRRPHSKLDKTHAAGNLRGRLASYEAGRVR